MKKALFALLSTFTLLVSPSCAPVPAIHLTQIETAVASLGKAEAGAIMDRVRKAPDRLFSLLDAVLAEAKANPMILARVDKAKSLPRDFEPSDLVSLDGKGLSVSKKGLKLRRSAFDALSAMSAAAKSEGITLTVSSSYRDYAYQEVLFARNITELGEKEASRVSARPGSSQHQLGTAIDFGSITDAFAETKASKWLVANAGRFGFSLSYPRGMESVTGYVWESWHYRYIGLNAALLQAEYFGGVQQYFMLFLDAFRQAQPNR